MSEEREEKHFFQAECLLHKLYIRIRHPHYYILNDNEKAALNRDSAVQEICFFIARVRHPRSPARNARHFVDQTLGLVVPPTLVST